MILAALALAQTTSATTDVTRLVRQVRAAYATCKTYRDFGTQMIWNVDKARTKTIWGEWKFNTTFARPAQIRLEVSERKGASRWVSSVLWTIKKGQGSAPAQIHFGFDGSVERVKELRAGFASLASLSFGIADRVPLLLAPSKDPFDLLDEHEWKVGAMDKVRGHDCYVLRSEDSSVKLWIDKRTSLLVQIHEQNDVGGGRSTLKVVQYTPTLNTQVQQNEFKGPVPSGKR
ncbi:MAG: hypothetical protein IT363_16120 [Methanoregulaceae archaeon]|jgi:hypothetical protein|nr:hypothetical protein [Methanoregulaceae archaeon]